MTRLEDNIKQHRELFDHAEPSPEHFEKFSRKLARFNNPPRNQFNSRFILKIAASVVVLLTVSVLINYFAFDNRPFLFSRKTQAEIPAELQEVQMYYTSLTDEKLNQIDQLATQKGEAEKIKEKANSEIKELNADNDALKKEYIKSGNNERVFDAIVNNYRIISNLLDHIINELNQNNDNKSI